MVVIQLNKQVNKIFRILFRLAKDLISLPLGGLAFITPKNKNMWCFGANEGKRYADHSCMLFEEVREKHPEIKVYWSTRSSAVYAELKKRNIPVVHSNSFFGYFITIRSAVLVYTHYNHDHNIPGSFGAYKVHLWHGIPIKRFQADNNLTALSLLKWNYRLIAKIVAFRQQILPWNKAIWDLLIFQSDLDKERTGSALRRQFKKSQVLGSIRAEWLTRKKQKEKFLLSTTADKKKIKVLYAPTHRKLGMASLFESVPVPDVDTFKRLLTDHGILLEVRMHPFQAHEPLPESFLIPEVNVPKEQLLEDIYESLFKFDVIITDYSSVYIDSLAIDTPVICLAPDRAIYASEDQGFYSGIEEFPGPIVDTWQEALSICKTLIPNTDEFWKDKYDAAKKFYFNAPVPHNKEVMSRVIEKLKTQI